MSTENYKLKDILETFFTYKNNEVRKKLIYDQAFLNKMSSFWLKVILSTFPFIIYALIFNERSFAYFGIAQAIVVFIISLVALMQLVIAIIYFNNKKAVKLIVSSWESYFPEIDFKLLLSSGVTPYVDFKKKYAQALNDNLEGDSLYTNLKKSFLEMQEENKDLLDAMNKDRNK